MNEIPFVGGWKSHFSPNIIGPLKPTSKNGMPSYLVDHTNFNIYCIFLSFPDTMDKRCPISAGTGMDGSSVINSSMYVRGLPKDFDPWAEQGNPGWNYEQPYFHKSEMFHKIIRALQ